MRAYCLIRPQPCYRREAFCTGLKAVGLDVLDRRPDRIDADTLIVIWNRYADMHELACRVERAGGRVIVAENGYIGSGGGTPKFQVHPGGPQPGHYYAIAEGHHNGAGTWPSGGAERWARLGVELRPWRGENEGGHILVCPNRSFGVADHVMHPDWGERCAARLRKTTRRRVRVRPHPGNNEPARPLSEDLDGAWAVVVWRSSCGVHALVEGIPVFCEGPAWILKGAAATGSVDAPVLPERLPHFERLAWGQWTCEEIGRGEPFRHLLSPAGQGTLAPGA